MTKTLIIIGVLAAIGAAFFVFRKDLLKKNADTAARAGAVIRTSTTRQLPEERTATGGRGAVGSSSNQTDAPLSRLRRVA